MQYEHISNQRDLTRFCEATAGAEAIAFDTEFVSEDRYRPELCLIQVAAAGHIAIIDALAIDDLVPFWEWLVADGHQTLVHAGRHELCFCLEAIGRRPSAMFDTQIAAGLIGMEYPAAYSTLISRLLGKSLAKGETRTDWRRRPLSRLQLDYAAQDVIYLDLLRGALVERLEQLDRTDWFWTEMDDWQSAIETAELSEKWRRVSGIAGLSRSSLGIVRELWRWRETEAREQNRPARRVLRDDLIVELSKRASSDVGQIQSVRGLNRRDMQRNLPAVATCIERALSLPAAELPKPAKRARRRPQFNLLGQFLAAAMSGVCREQQVAPSLVGTVENVRDLVAYHLRVEPTDDDIPALARGWRGEVMGRLIHDLLLGKVAIHVRDALDEQPLGFSERVPQPSSEQE